MKPEADDVIFLLGAGASRGAGVPLARELTARVLQSFDSGAVSTQQAQALNYVASALVAHRGRRGLSPLELPDIETLVSSVELLRDRDEVELSPFVQAWDPGVGSMDQDGSSQQLRAKYLLNRSASGVADLMSSQGADELIEFVRAEVGLAPGRVYAELLPALYRSLVDVLQIRDPAALHYLEPLVRRGVQPGGVTIATLNYDLSIETTADATGIACSTGLQGWEASGEVRFEEQGVRLLKLHGSIDWTRGYAAFGGLNGGLGINRETLVLRPPDGDALPFLLFGRREKLRPEGPFLDLRAEFGRRLRRCRFLVAVGYSFGDDHVNELVAHWVNSGADRILVVVDPGFPSTWTVATQPFQMEIADRTAGSGLIHADHRYRAAQIASRARRCRDRTGGVDPLQLGGSIGEASRHLDLER